MSFNLKYYKSTPKNYKPTDTSKWKDLPKGETYRFYKDRMKYREVVAYFGYCLQEWSNGHLNLADCPQVVQFVVAKSMHSLIKDKDEYLETLVKDLNERIDQVTELVDLLE